MPLEFDFIAPEGAILDLGRDLLADLQAMPGMVGAWSPSSAVFDPQTGIANMPLPATVGANALPLTNGGSVQIQDVAGYGPAFRMEGRLAARHSFDPGNVGTDFTIAARFRFDDLATSFQTVFGLDAQYSLRYSPSAGRFQFVLANTAINAAQPVVAGWYDAIMCVGGGNSRLFITRIGEATETVDHPGTWPASNMRIGGTANGGTGGFTGYLRNSVLLNRSLRDSPDDLQTVGEWLSR